MLCNCRYEELERQLLAARAQADAAEEAAELARAAAAVARLTAPESGANVSAALAGSTGEVPGSVGSTLGASGGAAGAAAGTIWGAGRSGSKREGNKTSFSSMDEADNAAAAQTAQVGRTRESGPTAQDAHRARSKDVQAHPTIRAMHVCNSLNQLLQLCLVQSCAAHAATLKRCHRCASWRSVWQLCMMT